MFFTYKTYIDYPDTDAGGIVFHSRYIEIAHRARSAMLRYMETSNVGMQQDGYSFMVKKLSMDYHAAAGLDSEIIVVSKAKSIQGARIMLQQKIYQKISQKPLKLLTTMDIMLAFVSTVGKPIRVPKWFKEKLEKGEDNNIEKFPSKYA